MENKSLGVIGGMGPKATAVFFDKVIENTVAQCDQEHVDMLIMNHATIPDRTTVIMEGTEQRFLDAVARDLKLMEHAGVAHIAIPCNTSHYFYDDMQAMTSIPIIHMVEETIRLIHDRYGAGIKVGVLATSGTMKTGVYAKACQKYGIDLHIPNETMQAQTMKIIYSNVKRDMDFSPEELEVQIDELRTEHGCSCVILACTELSCITLGPDYRLDVIDAMQVLVERSIILSGRTPKSTV
ncbi:aspartate/glutamate racemase family protein [Paenibacillus paeoniae]|uniref:Amino acid racemase n=1 Tax=Paenibacillus paeoniae TaxID=2292705 RepID=A0A371P0J7_9BACL|nr:amino acid racemase [Paenibacillus paeoniae]REK69462.1 amino acid racemase [Paenibacillus paeoniae]